MTHLLERKAERARSACAPRSACGARTERARSVHGVRTECVRAPECARSAYGARARGAHGVRARSGARTERARSAPGVRAHSGVRSVRCALSARGAPCTFRSAYGAPTRPRAQVRSACGVRPERVLVVRRICCCQRVISNGVGGYCCGEHPQWVWAVLPPPPEGGIPVGASFPRGAVCGVSRCSPASLRGFLPSVVHASLMSSL